MQLSLEPLSAPDNTRDTQAIALERVIALGRQWLADAPEPLLQHFARQAEPLLQFRAELRACQAQLQDCQAQLQQLQEESPGSVAPFRRTSEESATAPRRLVHRASRPRHGAAKSRCLNRR